MAVEIEIGDDLAERLDVLREDDQSYADLIEELVHIYETEGTFGTEGYSE